MWWSDFPRRGGALRETTSKGRFRRALLLMKPAHTGHHPGAVPGFRPSPGNSEETTTRVLTEEISVLFRVPTWDPTSRLRVRRLRSFFSSATSCYAPLRSSSPWALSSLALFLRPTEKNLLLERGISFIPRGAGFFGVHRATAVHRASHAVPGFFLGHDLGCDLGSHLPPGKTRVSLPE